MKRILILSLLVLVAAQSWAQFRSRSRGTAGQDNNSLNYASPGEYTIAAIEVTGLNILDKNAMVSLTGLKIGDKIKIPASTRSKDRMFSSA
jgi:outer membrane protein insertion porin family